MKAFLGGLAFGGGFLAGLIGLRPETMRAISGKLGWLADIIEQSDDERDRRLARMIAEEMRKT